MFLLSLWQSLGVGSCGQDTTQKNSGRSDSVSWGRTFEYDQGSIRPTVLGFQVSGGFKKTLLFLITSKIIIHYL